MYIRTKDGRIIDTTKIATGSKYMNFATNDESFREIFKTEPLAKSENLEELCDEFVIEFFASEVLVQVRYAEFQWAEEEFESDKKETLYGAIRVAGKGLIYVAKMNDKGEFELI